MLRPLISNTARLPVISTVDRLLCRYYTGNGKREDWPRGHFYSPLPDIEAVRRNTDRLYRDAPDLGPSIDLRSDAQLALLQRLARYRDELVDFVQNPAPDQRYHTRQNFYRHSGAYTLAALMRELQPRRIIEVGSGFSSALMLDVNDAFLQGRTRFTFIEPYPDRLLKQLRSDDHQRSAIIRDQVQNAPMHLFEELEANDFLFIDSSHVSKIGSDVNHLFFDVLPILKPGVYVHIHDVTWPMEYPLRWIEQGRAWNEIYLLRAFLQYNTAYTIELFPDYLAHHHREAFAALLPTLVDHAGGAIWLKRQPKAEVRTPSDNGQPHTASS